MSVPVIVRGTDPRGSAFAVTAKTSDISFSGASLNGLDNIVEPGAKIEVECGDQKACYRVQWVGQSGSPQAGHVGIRCLELGKYIWGVPPKEWEADTYDPSKPVPPPEPPPDPTASTYAAPPSWTGPDRRQFARHACRIEARVYVENDSVEMPGKITDISLGGCYVEMLQPLPVGTTIQLTLNPDDATLHVSGKVRSSQTGFGMGVAFTEMRPEDFEKLRKLVPTAANAPAQANVPPNRPAPVRDSTPARESAPHVTARSYAAMDSDSLDLSPTAEALDALVRLLLRKEIFTQGELAEELEKAKIVR